MKKSFYLLLLLLAILLSAIVGCYKDTDVTPSYYAIPDSTIAAHNNYRAEPGVWPSEIGTDPYEKTVIFPYYMAVAHSDYKWMKLYGRIAINDYSTDQWARIQKSGEQTFQALSPTASV
jgi:hypothetical protein